MTKARQSTAEYTFPIQTTRYLHVRRVDDGFLVWLLGTPHTKHHTYLYLHDDGTVQRVTESTDGDLFVLDVKLEKEKP